MATTHLLIINRNIRFSVRMKQSLEQYGGFIVSPFTAADTALDHLRYQKHDLALVDFTLPDMSGPLLVSEIRALQPAIAIIATPDLPDVAEKVIDLGLDGIIDVPCTLRDLLPVIRAALAKSPNALPDTMIAPSRKDDVDTAILPAAGQPTDPPAEAAPGFSSLDSVLFRIGGMEVPAGLETLDVDMHSAEYDAKAQDSQNIEVVLSDNVDNLNRLIEKLKEDPRQQAQQKHQEVEQSVNVFRQLAAEEPPMPSLEESGTVGELRALLENTDKREIAEHVLRGAAQSRFAHAQNPPEVDSEGNTARIILETTLDESGQMSLTQILEALDRGFPKGGTKGIQALPSWQRDEERYIREPDFLQDVSREKAPPSAPPPDLPEATQPMTQEQEAQDAAEMTWDEPAFEEDSWEEAAQTPTSQSDSPLDSLLPPYEFEDAFPDFEIPDVPQAPESFPEAPDDWQKTQKRQRSDEVIIDDLGAAFERAFGLDDSAAFHPGPATERPAAELPPYDFDQIIPVEAKDPTDSDSVDLAGLVQPRPPRGLPEAPITLGDQHPDPYIAQMALALTQVSLELTSEAALLTREGEIIAYAGALPLEDIEDIRHSIADDWQAAPGESRIRFVTLPGSGDDYMLYSRRTEAGFTLSLVFLGNTPLRVIRRQSDKLAEALAVVPEQTADYPEADPAASQHALQELAELEAIARVEEESALQSTSELEAIQAHLEHSDQQAAQQDAPAALMPPPAPPLTAYTYLWLIREPEKPLTALVAQAIVNQLDYELESLGWRVNGFNVYEDYIYLLAEVPGETLPNEVVADLKARSARIAAEADPRINPHTLWADSYCVLTPGREMHQEEIQRFINFSRMR